MDTSLSPPPPHLRYAPPPSSSTTTTASEVLVFAAEGSYPLPAFLKFCPGGITFAAAAAAAAGAALPPLQFSASVPMTTPPPLLPFWYPLATTATPRELSKRLIQEAQTADDRLRQYQLLYHHQQLQQQQHHHDAAQPTTQTSSSSSSQPPSPPLVLPSLSVLCEAVFGRLTGVPPELVRDWADAMVLAHLDEDEKLEAAAGGDAAAAALVEQPPESEDDIWNAKPKAAAAAAALESSLTPAAARSSNSAFATSTFPGSGGFHSASSSSNSSNSAFSLTFRLKDRLAKASAQVAAPRQRRPCGYVFARGDIAWNCRTCQTDATCVICDDCFRQSNHEGHEVYFHRTSPGGCCDCGDVEAWKIQGCCPDHRPEMPPAMDEDDDYEDDDSDQDEDMLKNGTDEDAAVGTSMSEDSNEPDRRKQQQQAAQAVKSKTSGKPRRSGRSRRSTWLQADPLEAVRTARKGQELQQETLSQAPTALPPKTTAALATVIGAAVGCLVQAVDGAGIGADPIQFKAVWAQEAAQIALGYSWPEEAFHHLTNSSTLAVQASDYANGRKLPKGYQLQLRLHNDDVHTFEEVIDALHEPRSSFRRGNEHHPHHSNTAANNNNNQNNNNANNDPSLVPLREQATEMTHHVDADGQVTVKVYDNCVAAMQGYRRLKTRGLHCAVVSTAQLQLEQRAKQLASWLTELSSAHPVAAALCVHALVQVDPTTHLLAGYHVWPEARSIPAWAGSLPNSNGDDEEEAEEDELLACRRRFQAFPPHLESSYCTRLEAYKLHSLARGMPGFVELTWADLQFYQATAPGLIRRLLLERYRKSPHALWGTLPALYHDTTLVSQKHALLARLAMLNQNSTTAVDWERQGNQLTETVFVVDTDLRKQQEADRISSSVYPYKLPGLHLLLNPNNNTANANNYNNSDTVLPNPMEFRHLLAISSFRAPVSSILLLLLLDPYPTKQLRGATHALFLSLLTDSRFKCRFAGAFGVSYRPLSTLFCAGVGTEADTPLHFSVQILTAGSLVRALGHAPATEQLLVSDNYNNQQSSSNDKNKCIHAVAAGPNTNNNNTLGVFCSPIAHTIARCIHTNLLGATKEVNMILTNTFSVNDEDEDDDGQQSTNSNDTLLPALTYVAGEHPLLTLLPAAPDDGFLDSRSTRHKRLPHLIRDLEYVIETPGTALRLLLFSKFPVYQGPTPLTLRSGPGGGDDVLVFPTVFARLLRLAQGMDPQKRKISGGHVEYEQNRWLEAFGLSLNIASARDALAESPAKTDADDTDTISAFREAMGNLNAALLREIKLWLYREGLLETGLPIPPGGGIHGPMDLAQAEALQRSTLHVSGSSGSDDHLHHMDTGSSSSSASNASGSGMMGSSGYLTHHHHIFHHHPNSNHNMVALSCATGVKMTEHQLGLIENALKAEGEMRLHRLSAMGMATPGESRFFSSSTGPSAGLVMGDWLRVPHSPLAGDSLSFHLPLHRALAKSVRSLCSVVMPDSVRDANPTSWWKIPVLDDDPGAHHPTPSSPYASSFPTHPLVPLLKSTIRSSNCRVVWMLGPDCTPQEAQRRRARTRNVSAHIAVTKVLHSLADHPIRCLAAAQQIERHLWARNGSPVAGMAMNYTSTPLCRAFRDLDLLLVQLSATGWNVGLGARRVFALLLSRFNMDGYLCDPERRSTGGGSPAPTSNSSGSPAMAAAAASMMHHHPHHRLPGAVGGGMANPNTFMWVNPPRLQDPDHAVVLSESFFSTLCVLVTELPPPPPRSSSDNSALRQSIRRELLHALASEPRSRSEAMTAAALGVNRRDESEGSSSGGGAASGGVASGGGLFRATFAQVLDEIGQAKKTTARSRITPGAPPSFELSADCCEEYDPTFFHLRRQEHQHAMDIVARLRTRKFPSDCLPLVCPPPKAHPRFLPCRLLLHLPALDASIRRALLFALTGGSWLPPPEPVVIPPDDLKTMNQNDEDDDDDDDIILHDGLAAPANFSMTASGDVVISSFSSGLRRSGTARLATNRLATNRFALGSGTGPTSSFFRRHQSHEDPLQRNGKPFSKEVVAASAISFLEVLQLLTLQAHTLEECAALHRTLPDLDEESRLISSGLSINTYLSRLVWVPESLVDVWALRPSSQGGPLDSKGSGERRGSVLGLLIALYEHRSDHSAGFSGGGSAGDESDGDGTGKVVDEGHHGGARHLAAHGLKWLLRFVRALVDGAVSVKAAAKSATTGVPIIRPQSSPPNSSNAPAANTKLPSSDTSLSYSSSPSAAGWTIDEGVRRTIQGMLDNLPDLWPSERRNTKQSASDVSGDSNTMSASKRNKEAGKEAQRRVLELMMQKQRKFAATIDDSNDAAENATSDVVEECIICRCDDADGEINGPLGYLGHVQRSRSSQMRSVLEAEMASSEQENNNDNSRNAMLMRTFRVIGHMGCQLRETEALDSKPLMCLPRGSVVTVLRRAFSAEYGILSRRVLVRHVKKPSRTSANTEQRGGEEPIVSEGWASVMSSQGYVILSPLVFLCYANSKWGATRPILKQCGHAAHLKCVETHTLSLHQRAAGEQPYDGRFAANIADGEFLCPLCKQLSNILIPRDTPSTATASGGVARGADKMDLDQDTSPGSVLSIIASPPSSRIRRVPELFHVPRLTQRNEEDSTDLRVKALEDFGSHLYQAMEVSWDRTMNNRKKQQKWHPAIRKWDYEEESSGGSAGSMGLPRLLRQQLIAWAAVGHSASAAEAGARAVEEVLPFGISSQTSDPWNGFTPNAFKTHAMLRELKRTLSGASGLLEALCVKMTNRLLAAGYGADEEEPHARKEDQTPVILRCLSDLLEGRSWIVSSTLATAGSARDLALWTQVTALTAALPCHVARDGVLSLRCEARATAAAMWATKGGSGGSSSSATSSFNSPTLPLAVRNVLTSVTPPLRMPESWGSTDPCVSSSTTDAGTKPFRLGIASGYMYTPLLAWDLNTFSGAVFSALLLQDVHNLPNNKELLQIVRILLCARIVQAVSMPGGFDVPEADDLDDEEDCWPTPEEVQIQGTSLSRLVGHCRAVIATHCLDPNTALLGSTDVDSSTPSPFQLLAGVGRAILPFARSLILLIRATVAVSRDRLEKIAANINGEDSEEDKILQAAIFDRDIMECEDGFIILKALQGPLPSELVAVGDESGEWLPRLNRWLVSLVGFEMHQGSSGRSLLPLIADKLEGNSTKNSLERQLSDDRSPRRSTEDAGASSIQLQQQGEPGVVVGDQVMAEAQAVAGERAGEVNANEGGFVVVRHNARAAMVDDIAGNDEAEEIIDEVDMDDAEEMVGMVEFADPPFSGATASGHDDSHESSDENSESGSEDGFDNSAEFANVSRSPIIPYQSSFLGMDQIGPGRHGATFEYGEASAVMSDLSILATIHRKHIPTFNLVRLPKSFVELYNIVSKVKGREESGGTDEHEDVGNSETAICLLTGTVMRSGSPRRSYTRSIRPPGACTLHARKHGSGIGIFFLVQKCTVLLMHNNKSAYSPSIFVDEHGEEDPGLRRGRPLFLNDVRYRALELLWRHQGIPREVAQIRSTSDRVIRDNWY
ncbi:hypothetical protein ACA910_010445 [Epithemia clementina (nom. ined.)]